MLGYCSISFNSVPPHPISISSQCAPKQSTRRAVSRCKSKFSLSIHHLQRFPGLPGCVTAGTHLVDLLAILESIHTHPETLILIRGQLSFVNQAAERCFDKFFA